MNSSNDLGTTTTFAGRQRTARLRAARGTARRSIAGVVAVMALVGSACGGDSDGAEPASNEADSVTTDSAATEAADAPAAPSIDLDAVSACIDAAGIVVAPSSYSEAFMEEQNIVAALALGAMGNEFGGGTLFYLDSESRAAEVVANLGQDGEELVQQNGVQVLQYNSAVQDEVAGVVFGCSG